MYQDIASDGFLRLGERPVKDRLAFLAGNNLTLIGQWLTGPGLSLFGQSIEPGDQHGTFGELARAVRAMAESIHTPIELHLFSDMQRGDLAATFSDMTLPPNVTLLTHAVIAKGQLPSIV